MAQDWLNRSRRSRLDLFLILSYSPFQEIARRIMVKIVKNQKKILFKSFVEQMLSLNKMVNLMLFNQRPIEKELQLKV